MVRTLLFVAMMAVVFHHAHVTENTTTQGEKP